MRDHKLVIREQIKDYNVCNQKQFDDNILVTCNYLLVYDLRTLHFT